MYFGARSRLGHFIKKLGRAIRPIIRCSRKQKKSRAAGQTVEQQEENTEQQKQPEQQEKHRAAGKGAEQPHEK